MDKSVIASFLARQTRVVRPPAASVDAVDVTSDKARPRTVDSQCAPSPPSVVGIFAAPLYKVPCFDQRTAIVVAAIRVEAVVRTKHASAFVVLQYLR